MSWADRLRKAIAKKNPKSFAELEIEFFKNAQEKKLSEKLVKYVWYSLIYTQRGYGFNSAHTLSYSLIALQELNLCYKYPIIYWNCANLCVDSGSLEGTDKTTNYGKMAIAMATMKKSGVNVALPLINSAQRRFLPDVEKNRIVFSLKAINGVGDADVEAILINRPYSSLEDFCDRLVLTKQIKNSTMIALIKGGCFTELDNADRKATLVKYLHRYAFEPNTKLTMANLDRIESMGIIPEDLKIQLRILRFVDYVINDEFFVRNIIIENKKIPKCGYHDRLFKLNHDTMPFYTQYLPEECVVEIQGDNYIVSEKRLLKASETLTEGLREWIKSDGTLQLYNEISFKEIWNKYGLGTEASWNMNTLSYYNDEHELAHANLNEHGVVDYFNLLSQPQPYDCYYRYVNGNRVEVPKFEIVRIAGTVLNSDNNHHTVTLLTLTGVVNVKFNKGQYAFYNQQISQLDNETGKKKVLDKSWFKRGNLLIVCGYRQDDVFRAYRYKDTVYLHTVYKIEEIKDDGNIIVSTNRAEAS